MSESRYQLAGKVALVTGAGRGMGRGFALELAQRGASVVVNYASSSSAAQSVVKEIEALGSKAVAIKADLTKVPEIRTLFAEALKAFGKIDIVISNSGTEIFKTEEEITEDDFDRVFNLNTRAQFFVAQQALIHMERAGKIILMSSISVALRGMRNHAIYAGSKAAVEAFTRSFAVDCGPKRITCNAIAPGGVKTDMFSENAWHYVPGGTADMSMASIEAGIAGQCPLGRVAVPEDISRVVAFLCHTESDWINGQVLQLTGGGL